MIWNDLPPFLTYINLRKAKKVMFSLKRFDTDKCYDQTSWRFSKRKMKACKRGRVLMAKQWDRNDDSRRLRAIRDDRGAFRVSSPSLLIFLAQRIQDTMPAFSKTALLSHSDCSVDHFGTQTFDMGLPLIIIFKESHLSLALEFMMQDSLQR